MLENHQLVSKKKSNNRKRQDKKCDEGDPRWVEK